MTDEELERLAQRLGARAAERLDVERAAEAVVARLRQRPSSAWRRWAVQGPAWLKIAAAAVLVLGVGLVARTGWRDRPPVAAMVPLSEDLSGLSAAQLREAIAALDQPLPDDAGAFETGLEGLSPDELRALLRSLEG